MSETLTTAVHEVEQVYRGLAEISRVDVDSAGAVQLTAEGREGTRWFVYDDRGLIERFPARDPDLPLAALLSGDDPCRVLSYRPGRRMVVEAKRGEIVNVLKGHRVSRSARAAVNHGIAEGAMRRGAFRVPRMLLHDGKHEALVFEFMPGQEVDLADSSAPFFGRIGEALAVFQRDPSAADLKPFLVRDEIGVLDLWKHKVLQAMGDLPAGWLEARERIEHRSPELPGPTLGLAHRDLHDRQILRVDEEVGLLDFDLICRADVALDAGNLVAHLRWRALQGLFGAREPGGRQCEQSFLDGLDRGSEPGFLERLAFYTSSALLRLSLVYRLRPRWSARASELVALAGLAFEERFSLG